jgi:outer membrane protein assembly factor BamD (BamD/ComL family)
VTYRDEAVIALMEDIVKVRIDADVDTTLRREYGVAGFPTVVLANADGSEIDRIYGYAGPEDFVEIITDYLNDKNTLADYLRQAEAEPTMALYTKIAEKYTGRSKFNDAEQYYLKILDEDPDNEQGYSDSALFSMGQMKSRAKEYSSAEEIFTRFRRTYPESGLADDAYYETAKTYRYAEDYDKAIETFKSFTEVYPESDLAETANIYIAYCHDLKGEKDQALSLYEKFLTDFPNSSDTNWVKKQIDKIKNPPPEEESEK